MEFLLELDRAVFLFFNAQLTHPILDAVMPRITRFSFWTIPGILAAAVFVWRGKKQALIVLGLGVLVAAISDPLSSRVLKEIFGRPRPCHPELFVEGGRFLIGMRRSLSFPSTHSMNMFSVAMMLYCFYPKFWMYFFPFAALIAYSRVYCGMHFPADILAGAAFGCLLGWGVYRGYQTAVKKIVGTRKKPEPNLTS
jgi:undecaprenyl-diphosphatase